MSFDKFPTQLIDDSIENTQEKISSAVDIYGEPVADKIDEWVTAFEMSEHSLIQVYIACSKDVLPSIITDLSKKLGISNENIAEIHIRPKHNNLFPQIKGASFIHGEPFLVIADEFSEAGVVGHGLNQSTHYDFLKSDLIKGVLVIHIDSQSTSFKDALRTAKDSQFKASILEMDYSPVSAE